MMDFTLGSGVAGRRGPTKHESRVLKGGGGEDFRVREGV